MVSSGWSQQRIGKRIKVRCGFAFKSELFREAGIPVVRISNIQNGHVDLQGSPCYDEIDNLEQFKVRYGDVLIAMSGATTGKVGRFFPEDASSYAYLNQRVGKFEVKDSSNTDLDFFHQITQTNRFLRSVLIDSIGGAQPNVSGNEIENIVLGWPQLPEQKKIAKILYTWDNAIETVDKIIENSQKQKKWLMQKLLTGQKRLPGFSGDWKIMKLSEVASITMGSSPKSEAYNTDRDGLPLIQGNADISNRKSNPRVYTSQITKICKPNDILISVRAPVGEVAISLHKACIGRGIAAISPKRLFSHSYILQQMLFLESRWGKYSQGSTFEAINSKELRDTSIYAPQDFKEQYTIGNILSSYDKELEKLNSLRAQTLTQKQALMQQLLTGKCRVKISE